MPPLYTSGAWHLCNLAEPPLMSLTHRRQAHPTSSLNPSWVYSCHAVLMTATSTPAVHPTLLLPPSPSPVSSVSLSYASSRSSVSPPFAPASARPGRDSLSDFRTYWQSSRYSSTWFYTTESAFTAQHTSTTSLSTPRISPSTPDTSKASFRISLMPTASSAQKNVSLTQPNATMSDWLSRQEKASPWTKRK